MLIVDDNIQNLYFLEVLLKGNGFGVRSAADGAEALDAALAEPPDLIICDILMPVMDGYSLCREWRVNERLRSIPFIFYTATFIDPKDEALALSLGADRFLIKPQEPEVLVRIIREVLEEGARAGGAPVPDIPADDGVLREYNEALFRKLEKKMADLELTNRELEATLAEQKRLEEQLRQAQKMEAIGRFAGGIAHDFNNLLTVIIGCGTMLRMGMASDNPLHAQVEHVLSAADRATNLTRSLLTFSHKQEMQLQPVDLNRCISKIETFLRRIIGEDIAMKISFAQEDVIVVADGGHIEQALMNLATNARDAMPTGGVLSIGIDTIDIDDAFIRMHGYGAPGRYAALSVADTGIGMDAATRQRVFEPFFTTKQAGKGTGLGLSIVYGIVTQHQGYITLYSEEGQGTTFRILLPLSSLPAVEICSSPSQGILVGGRETILVADDELTVREYLASFLSGLGYTILLARDGQDAVERFREKGADIDLVLMDVIMTKKNGRETALEIRGIRNDVPILFVSGYPFDVIEEKGFLEDRASLLMKPLAPVELAGKLRQMLNGKPAA
ncbi:MAG: response regulator [Geobacter sp.]|nr:response regulator [Geobacter sp.]